MAIDTGQILDVVRLAIVQDVDAGLVAFQELVQSQTLDPTPTPDGRFHLELSGLLLSPLVVAIAAIHRLADAKGESVEQAILDLRVDLFDWPDDPDKWPDP